MCVTPMATSWPFTCLAKASPADFPTPDMRRLPGPLARFCWLGIGLCMALSADLAAAQVAGPDSRFERIVRALQSAEPALTSEFASTALLELVEVYLAEADLARREAEQASEADRLSSWSRAVEQYAGQLSLVLEDVDLGFPVDLRLHPREAVSVSVGGRTIMLAHPRHGQQPVYEQSVLQGFCGNGLCRTLIDEEEALEPIPMSAALVTPHWEFASSGPRCSYRNLAVSFTQGGSIARQRALCQQLMQEAELLATELAWQQRHKVDIDWEQLSLAPVPLRPEHLVTLNRAGDSLLVSLPLLNGTEGLLAQLTPWLQSRHAEEIPQVHLDAGNLGWE